MSQNSPIPVPASAPLQDELGDLESTTRRTRPAGPVRPSDTSWVVATPRWPPGPVEVDLQDELEDLLHHLGPRAHPRNLDLVLIVAPETPQRIVVEANHVRQVLGDLIAASIRLSLRGEVVVEASLGDNPGEVCVAPSSVLDGKQASKTTQSPGLQFVVRDGGAGAPLDKLSQLLAPVPASATLKDPDTWESHLARAARLAPLLGGKLTVQSVAGKGNRFVLSLPPCAAATQGRKTALASTALRQRSILLADDSPTLRRVVADCLAGWGMRVTVVDGGQAALQAVRQAHEGGRPFDLVLLDARMPRPSGLAVAEHLSRQSWTRGPTFLLVSPPYRRDDETICRRVGIHGLLTKPLRRRQLFQSLAAAVAPTAQPLCTTVDGSGCNL